MKIRTGLLSLIMFAAFVMVKGQVVIQRPSIEERTKRIVDTITMVLKLDQSQQVQAQSTFTDYYKESDKLREAVQAGTLPEKAQFEKLATDRDEKLKRFLTLEQLKRFKDELEPIISKKVRVAMN